VTIQDPKGIYYGGYLGGPVFKEVMSFVLKDQKIPPTPKAKELYALDEKSLAKKIALQSRVPESKP
jgi:cell division protein FtsI (penicillin-binding protein 3)